MTRFKHFWIILWLISSPVHAEFRHFGDWTNKEKGLYTAYNVLSYIDYTQTKTALRHPCECFKEANPLFGDYPHPDKLALTQATVSGILYYWIGSEKEDQLNNTMIWGIAVRSYVVYHNNEVGLSWQLAF